MKFLTQIPFSLFRNCIVFISLVWSSQLLAQNQTITLHGTYQLSNLFNEIEKQAKVSIGYDESVVDLNNEFQVQMNDKKLNDALAEIFSGTIYTYTLTGKYVVIKKAPLQTDDITVRGRISDANGSGLPSVNVIIKGSNQGVFADMDGNYLITIPKGTLDPVLRFAFMGYQEKEEVVQNRSMINVRLDDEISKLDEVIVVGYGTQKKVNLTGAVSSIKMDEVLGDRPVTNVMTALQGSIPGLVITGGSSPSQSKKFNVRGITSISDGMDNIAGEPLVLVDNVPADIDMLNPEDIESVTLLKDAASAAIYGARAAFGVLLITTKKAKKGTKFQFNYNNNFGIQKSINRPKQAAALDFLKAYKDAEFTGGKWFAQSQDIDLWMQYLTQYQKDPSSFNVTDNGVYVPLENNPGKIRYYLKDTDKYDNMLANYGFIQNHNFSTMGNSDKISYRMSLGYTDNQGILITDKDRYKRISATSYLSSDITSWLTQALDIRYARSNSSEINVAGQNIWDLRLPNIVPEGEMESLKGNLLPLNTAKNAILYSAPRISINENPRIFSRTVIKPFEGFEAVLEYTYDKKIFDLKQYDKSIATTSVQLDESLIPANSRYINVKSESNYNALNAYLTYAYAYREDHNFKLMTGYNQETKYFEELDVRRLSMINEEKPSFTGAYGETTATDKFRAYAIRSGFFRLNYDYKGTYLAEINGRYDGSSKFPKDTRFGFFPSFSLGWQLANEKFMGWSKSYLNTLKFRVSWGEIGNQSISEYAYIPTLDSEKAEWIDPSTSQRPTTLKPPKLVRTNFTWEKVSTLDFGADIALLNNRLQSTFDWYQRDTKGMLAPGMDLPSVVGALAPDQNAADLRTKGWELAVSWRDQIGAVGYHLGFNVFDSKTHITQFHGNEKGVLTKAGSSWKNEQQREDDQFREGYEFGAIWGFLSDGYYSVDDFENTTTWKLKQEITSIKGVNVRPGDMKFKNLNDAEGSVPNQIDEGNNTVENAGDRVIIGNTSPRYQFGFNAGVNWKGFDLSVFLQGTGSRDVWINDDLRWAFNSGNFGTIFDNQLDYWKPIDPQNGNWNAINPNAKWHRIYGENGNSSSNRRKQSKYLMDASYVRLKNITLSYSFPKELIQKIKLSGVKAFVSAENVYTWTSLPKGYDPERLTWQYPFYRTISFGVNLTL